MKRSVFRKCHLQIWSRMINLRSRGKRRKGRDNLIIVSLSKNFTLENRMIIRVSTFPTVDFVVPQIERNDTCHFSLVRTWMHVNLSRPRTSSRHNIVCNFSNSYFIMHGLTPDHASIRHQHRLESYRAFFDNSSFFFPFFFFFFFCFFLLDRQIIESFLFIFYHSYI